MTRYSYDSDDEDESDFMYSRDYEAFDQLQLDMTHASSPRPPASLTPLNSYSPSHACPVIHPVPEAHTLDSPAVQPPKLSRKLSRFSIRSLSTATSKTPSLLKRIPSLTTTSSSLRQLWTKNGQDPSTSPPSRNSGKPLNMAPNDETSEKKPSLLRRFIFKQERSSLSSPPGSCDGKNQTHPLSNNASLPVDESHPQSPYYQKSTQQPQAVQFSVCKLGPQDQAAHPDNIPKRGFSIRTPFKENVDSVPGPPSALDSTIRSDTASTTSSSSKKWPHNQIARKGYGRLSMFFRQSD
ncbi:hypothetical protein HDU81_005864 [Chytriomyces hyalinus]|nr:hypothetical protein HDU81_005864 [Chytriomyces hyalinus]